MGATSGFKIGIASPLPIDIGLVTAGAVNSWLAGNYNYDISDAYPDLTQGKLSAADAANLAKLSVTQDTAGFFNLPVCKVLDLRSFPNAAAGTGYANSESASVPVLVRSFPCLSKTTLTSSRFYFLAPSPFPWRFTYPVFFSWKHTCLLTHSFLHSSLRLRFGLRGRRRQ